MKNDPLATTLLSEIELQYESLLKNNGKIEFPLTIINLDGNFIIKAGNKKAIAYYEYISKLNKGGKDCYLAVYLIEKS